MSLQETERLKSSLKCKIDLQDKLEIENLEMHLMLDAKLRALESVLRCGADASTLFKYDRKDRREFAMQTELNIEEIYMIENQNEVVAKEL